ncbi:hypothetical protein QUB47_07725 [Microcoleus sp. AT9_B5]
MSNHQQEQPKQPAQKKGAPEYPPATPPQQRTVSRNDGADR